MSAAPERREPIDIDEFERRLRGPEPVRRAEDPLAELARLVGGQNQQAVDPFAELFADKGRRSAPPVAPPLAPPPVAPPFAPHIVPPPVEAEAPQRDPFADFPDLRPLLRGADHGPSSVPPIPPAPEPRDFALPAGAEPYPETLSPSSQFEDWAEAPELSPDAPAAEVPRERSKKPLYVAAAVIAAGFVAIGSTLAWRGGAHQAGGVATIAASTNPTKVQPKEGEGGEKTARESTMLERTAAPPVKKVVTRDEQPMDVSAAAKTPRIIPLEENAGSTPAAASSSSGAASVPAVAPPAPSMRSASEPAQRSAFPEPKRVKTVSVRADGSIINGGGGESAASAPAAAPKAPERTTPAPARNATPKSATRADATSSAGAAAAPKPAAAKPKAEVKPEAKPEPKPAAKARVAAVQPKDDAPAAADASDDEAPKAASSGGYAVQVASAGSETEARQTAARLGDKLSGALGGRRPSVVKASDSLYRVRVTGLSKESATAMCGKVKAAGGACFVAR